MPVAAVAVSASSSGSFHRVERVLLALGAVFVTYIVSGLLAHPDWGAAAHGLFVPGLPTTRDAVLTATAIVGTTLAPWGLAFMQSYVVDKRISPRGPPLRADRRHYRRDVDGRHRGLRGRRLRRHAARAAGTSINDASDAARALFARWPGDLASTLFGAGLLGAALLAASILPLSTAYSVAEAFGSSRELDDPFGEARSSTAPTRRWWRSASSSSSSPASRWCRSCSGLRC